MRLQAYQILLVPLPLHLSYAAVFPRANPSDHNAPLLDEICPKVVTKTVTIREECMVAVGKRQDDSGIPADGFEGCVKLCLSGTQ